MYPPKFDKAFFAGFCSVLADLATNEGDDFSQYIFYEAGKLLAAHILAFKNVLVDEFSNNLTSSIGVLEPTNVDIVCEGSVWNSWKLLKNGFEDGLRNGLS